MTNQNSNMFMTNVYNQNIIANAVMLVGTIENMGPIRQYKNTQSYFMTVSIRVPRNPGRSDLVDCIVWNDVASAFARTCSRGNTVRVDGCLVTTPKLVGTPYEYTRYTVRIDKFTKLYY